MMRKSEFIDWREHQTLNNVTKLCIDYYETNYTFDTYLDDRSKKDNKFVNPLNEFKEENKGQEGERKKDENDSEFSMSGGEEDESHNGDDQVWERSTAEELYKRTRDEIETKYFIA